MIVRAADEFKDKTSAPNELRQTDFASLKVMGWGRFYLSTILDDVSRTIVAPLPGRRIANSPRGGKLCTTMRVGDVTATLELALEASGCDQATEVHRPRLLSDNGSSYVVGDLAVWLDERNMTHIRAAPHHPQTQGSRKGPGPRWGRVSPEAERWHQTLENRILLEPYYLPGDLQVQIETFVDHDNYHRYHESLGNPTPADVYCGRGKTILLERERIKRQTIQQRRLQHQAAAA